MSVDTTAVRFLVARQWQSEATPVEVGYFLLAGQASYTPIDDETIPAIPSTPLSYDDRPTALAGVLKMGGGEGGIKTNSFIARNNNYMKSRHILMTSKCLPNIFTLQNTKKGTVTESRISEKF